MIYIILFIMFVLLGFVDFVSVSRKTKLGLYFLAFLPLIVLGSIRWRTGSDWSSYSMYFTRYNTWHEFSTAGFEKGYAALNYFVKLFTSSYTAFLTFFSILVISIKVYTLQKNTNYLFVALLAYFCFLIGDIMTVRQSLAISLCLFSSIFIINKKPAFFLITVVLAFLIHNSAIVFLPAYWIYKIRLSNKVIVWTIVISILIGMSGVLTKLLAPLNFFFEVVGGETAKRMSTKLDYYSDNKEGGGALSNGIVLLFGIIRRSFFIPIYLLFRKKCEEKDGKYLGFLNLFVFGNLMYFIFASSILELVRATIFYIVFEIFLLSILIESFESLKVKIFVYWIVVLYCLLKLYYGLYAYWDLNVPFNTIFDANIQRVTY